MVKNIRGNIEGLRVVSRETLPTHHVVNIDGEDYVRSNPDKQESNNVKNLTA
ncbi:TPA: DUF3892 domain-containing protein [Photobacterium damselae]